MKEYIERELAIKQLEFVLNLVKECPDEGLVKEAIITAREDSISTIKILPAADVVSVKHGKWRLETDAEQPNPMFKLVVCSNCNSKANHTYPYCPYCGANNLSEEIKQGTEYETRFLIAKI